MNFKGAAVRLLLVLLLISSMLAYAQTAGVNLDYSDHNEVLEALLIEAKEAHYSGIFSEALIQEIANTSDPHYIAPLLDLGFFLRARSQHSPILEAVSQLSGQAIEGDLLSGESWRNLFKWASSQDLPLPDKYDDFKGRLFGIIVDPNFERFFQDVQDTAQVNLLEAVWGGVRVDGIPALVNAKQISPEAALQEGLEFAAFCSFSSCDYPADDELVFGLSINGDNRAYPLRLLNWHEMFNDVVGHAPLFDSPDGTQVCNFRAPTEFRAVARSGDWVQIIGESANCPEAGWLQASAVEWGSSDQNTDWQSLPQIPENALSTDKGLVARVKGKPVMLAYCTLCGSGILFDATLPEITYTDSQGNQLSEQNAVLEFGSTGMLMRSNKLMFDRTTHTVWNALSGTPAFGPLAGRGISLEVLPVVVTDWAEWLALHPDTTVLSLDTGVDRNYSIAGVYSDYFNSDELMFPVWLSNTEQYENKDMVFATKHEGVPKAYPLKKLINEPVVNDSFAGLDLVLVSKATPERDFFEPGGASVRAYERGDHSFTATEDKNWLLDESNQRWQVTEDALISASGQQLSRLAGHLAFWFGWYSFNPDTLVYE